MSLAPARIKFVRSISWVDLCLFSLLLLFVYALAGVAVEWTRPFRSTIEIDLGLWALPRYAFLSLFRGFAAYFLSLCAALFLGYWAAHSRLAERIIIPMVDILQSIPVLGFMPGAVLALVHLFPSSNIGLEFASVVMIFTGQAWNMIFSFYASVKGVPREIREMTTLYRLRKSEVFRKVEIPFAMNGLLWNSMVSMAGGWFFLMVVESFRLGDQDFRLPGIGSYMAVAIDRGDGKAIVAGIIAMMGIIILVDRCLWAPLVYSSSRYRDTGADADAEKTKQPSPPFVLYLWQKSQLMRSYYALLERLRQRREEKNLTRPARRQVFARARKAGKVAYTVAMILVAILSLMGTYRLIQFLSATTMSQWGTHFLNTFYTFLRVLFAVILGSAWAIPVGVLIGTHPRWTARLQPVVQVIAAFPAPMIFPLITYLFLSAGLPFNYGCTLLMLFGSQFYILFNVISGATQIPANLKDLGKVYRLDRWSYWKAIILPGIFPSLVNGWITAAGGAWNCSIVSEYVPYGGEIFIASGIGAAITTAAQDANFFALSGSIAMMVTVIVLINQFFWRWMYRLSETRFRLE